MDSSRAGRASRWRILLVAGHVLARRPHRQIRRPTDEVARVHRRDRRRGAIRDTVQLLRAASWRSCGPPISYFTMA